MALALLFVKVARAENHLVSSCRDPPCPDPADDGSIYELALFAQQQCSLGGETKHCKEVLLQANGGSEALINRVEAFHTCIFV